MLSYEAALQSLDDIHVSIIRSEKRTDDYRVAIYWVAL